MPVPAPTLYPPFNIVRLSHVEYRVTDLAASRAFYVDILGLQVTDEDESTVYLRAMEERGHHCIALVKADAPSVGFLAFKLFDEADLDKAADWFAGKGLPIDWVERPYQAAPCAAAICTVFRWNSTSGWTAWRRSISTTSFTTGSSRCASMKPA